MYQVCLMKVVSNR